jgi:hypothetical protein
MALGDIMFYNSPGCGYAGDADYQVLAGAVGSILPGEPVTKALGQQYVLPMATNMPVVGTDYLAGIAASTSTDTVALDGKVKVTKLVPGAIYLAKPLVPGTFATQALYDALVGARVLLDLTSGDYRILAADGATNGLVIEDLDIAVYPGQVAFSIRQGASYLA